MADRMRVTSVIGGQWLRDYWGTGRSITGDARCCQRAAATRDRCAAYVCRPLLATIPAPILSPVVPLLGHIRRQGRKAAGIVGGILHKGRFRYARCMVSAGGRGGGCRPRVGPTGRRKEGRQGSHAQGQDHLREVRAE